MAVEISAQNPDMQKLPSMTFLPENGVVVMDAKHFAGKRDVKGAGFRVLEGYGKYGSGVKIFPVTASFGDDVVSQSEAVLQETAASQSCSVSGNCGGMQDICALRGGCISGSGERPQLEYRFLVERKAVYQVELLTAPTNSPVQGKAVRLRVSVDDTGTETAELVSGDFRAGDHRDEDWCRGVLDQIRIAAVPFELASGIHRLTVGAMEAGVVLERIRIYPADRKLPESYLGPEETFYSRGQ